MLQQLVVKISYQIQISLYLKILDFALHKIVQKKTKKKQEDN